jgi:hypothetical protein
MCPIPEGPPFSGFILFPVCSRVQMAEIPATLILRPGLPNHSAN